MPDSNDIALPRSFDARYGAGADRGLSLGGGGLFFIAWQVAYLTGLEQAGVEVSVADRVVGTSAGSVVGVGLLGGRLAWMHREVALLARAPRVTGVLARSAELRPSQQRAWDLFEGATDSEPATVREIGHAALAATAPSPASMRVTFALLTGQRAWPSPRLSITCVDAFSAERCVITDRAGVSATVAMAASTSLPGTYAPQRVGQRFCMDGGVSGSALHLDLLAGSRRALVLSLLDDAEDAEPGMTFIPGSTRAEIEALAAGGTDVEVRLPESVDIDEIMDPAAVPRAVAMGHRQAATDAPGLQRFWS